MVFILSYLHLRSIKARIRGCVGGFRVSETPNWIGELPCERETWQGSASSGVYSNVLDLMGLLLFSRCAGLGKSGGVLERIDIGIRPLPGGNVYLPDSSVPRDSSRSP